MRGALGISENSIVIGHVARFHPMKDHVSFLYAVVKVMRHRSDIICLMVGKDVNLDNPSLADIVPPELKPRFRFIGERDDIPDLMRTLDLFCLSSWSEAFPNVLGEAMALGVPCIATDVGDVALILGNTGWLVPCGNPSLFAAAIESAIEASANKEQWLGRQRRCRKRICDEYTLEKMVERYQEIWMEVAARHDS